MLGTGQETSQLADLASNMKLAGGFGMGAGILSNSGGGGLPLVVGEGWVEEIASEGMGREGKLSDREDAGSQVWSAGLSPGSTTCWPGVT